MKEIKYLLILLVVLVLFLGLFSVLGIEPSTNDDQKETTAEPKLEERVYTEETEDFTIEFHYPELAGVEEETTKKVNGLIAEIRDASINDFKEFIPEINNLPQAPPSELVASYTTHFLSDEFLSVEFIVSTYMTGAAHPFSAVRTLNYNLEGNQEITLINAFEGNFLEEFSEVSAEEINQMNISPDQGWVLEGTIPIPKNFQSFVLDGENIVFIFDPYQVAPYAAGIIRVEVNPEEFGGFVGENSTLKNY